MTETVQNDIYTVLQEFVERPNAIDIVIPSYNTDEKDLLRCLKSAVVALAGSQHSELQVNSKIIVVDDCSAIKMTYNNQFELYVERIISELADFIKAEFPESVNNWVVDGQVERIKFLRNYQNMGAAFSRNVGAMYSRARLVAFLDSDDEYEPYALDMATMMLLNGNPQAGLVRLNITPVGFPNELVAQKDNTQEDKDELNMVWKIISMSTAGNCVFRRNLFLATGGFPTEKVFKEFGGEDGALSVSTPYMTQIITLFQHNKELINEVPAFYGVRHHYKEGNHAAKMVQLHRSNKEPIDNEKIQRMQLANLAANQVSSNIAATMNELQASLNMIPFDLNSDSFKNNIVDMILSPAPSPAPSQTETTEE